MFGGIVKCIVMFILYMFLFVLESGVITIGIWAILIGFNLTLPITNMMCIGIGVCTMIHGIRFIFKLGE